MHAGYWLSSKKQVPGNQASSLCVALAVDGPRVTASKSVRRFSSSCAATRSRRSSAFARRARSSAD